MLQSSEAHARDSFAGPLQVVPLFSGGGLVHDRLRSWNPLPHVTLHWDQEDHSDNPSATAKILNLINWRAFYPSVLLLITNCVRTFSKLLWNHKPQASGSAVNNLSSTSGQTHKKVTSICFSQRQHPKMVKHWEKMMGKRRKLAVSKDN